MKSEEACLMDFQKWEIFVKNKSCRVEKWQIGQGTVGDVGRALVSAVLQEPVSTDWWWRAGGGSLTCTGAFCVRLTPMWNEMGEREKKMKKERKQEISRERKKQVVKCQQGIGGHDWLAQILCYQFGWDNVYKEQHEREVNMGRLAHCGSGMDFLKGCLMRQFC